MAFPDNPFTNLKALLLTRHRSTAIASRLAHLVLAANSYRQALHLCGVLDAGAPQLLHTVYTDALNGRSFRDKQHGWYYTYDRLREHALSYLDTAHRIAA